MIPTRQALAAVLAAAFFCAPASAQHQPPVATIVAMETGDVACYLTLQDDAGRKSNELADFKICDQTALFDTRVSLTYRQGNVMADECQGNPDCKKTRSVMLVVSAKPAPR
jgi:hypothetical protein